VAQIEQRLLSLKESFHSVEDGESKEGGSSSSSSSSAAAREYYWVTDAAEAKSDRGRSLERIEDEDRRGSDVSARQGWRPRKQFADQENMGAALSNHFMTVETKKWPTTKGERQRNEDGIVVFSLLTGCGAILEVLKREDD
jgi:hypothetical protein